MCSAFRYPLTAAACPGNTTAVTPIPAHKIHSSGFAGGCRKPLTFKGAVVELSVACWHYAESTQREWLTDAASICSIGVCLYSFLLDRKFLLFDNRIKQARTRSVFLRNRAINSSLFSFFETQVSRKIDEHQFQMRV